MAEIFHSDRKYIYFLSGFFLSWIILFEFILPPNQVLPRPSIVVSSILLLFSDNQFLINMLSSISAIYFSLFIACLSLWIFRRNIINNKNLFGFLAFSLQWVSGIIPGILIGVFLIFWFPDSELTKYIFIFFASVTFLINKLENELKKVSSEFIDAAVSLGAGKNFISGKICWKIMEPAIAGSLNELHIYMWSLLIMFELIKGGSGIGGLLKTAILYKDLSGLFSYVIITTLIIFVGTTLIKYFKNKFIFWSID